VLHQVASLRHETACHLTADDRVRLWAEISAGEVPDEARDIPDQAGELPVEAAELPGETRESVAQGELGGVEA
jgi:hypothetical protein